MDETVAGRALVLRQRLTQGQGGGEASREPVPVDGRRPALLEYPQAERGAVVLADGTAPPPVERR